MFSGDALFPMAVAELVYVVAVPPMPYQLDPSARFASLDLPITPAKVARSWPGSLTLLLEQWKIQLPRNMLYRASSQVTSSISGVC